MCSGDRLGRRHLIGPADCKLVQRRWPAPYNTPLPSPTCLPTPCAVPAPAAGEIPAQSQIPVRRAYWAYLVRLQLWGFTHTLDATSSFAVVTPGGEGSQPPPAPWSHGAPAAAVGSPTPHVSWCRASSSACSAIHRMWNDQCMLTADWLSLFCHHAAQGLVLCLFWNFIGGSALLISDGSQVRLCIRVWCGERRRGQLVWLLCQSCARPACPTGTQHPRCAAGQHTTAYQHARLACTPWQVAAWLWSAIWFVGGVPGAYILWWAFGVLRSWVLAQAAAAWKACEAEGSSGTTHWATYWAPKPLGGLPTQAAALLLCRYARLYNAAIKDSAFGYAIFFAGFFANLVFSIWSAVGECGACGAWGAWGGRHTYAETCNQLHVARPQQGRSQGTSQATRPSSAGPPFLGEKSHTGFISAINRLSDNTGVSWGVGGVVIAAADAHACGCWQGCWGGMSGRAHTPCGPPASSPKPRCCHCQPAPLLCAQSVLPVCRWASCTSSAPASGRWRASGPSGSTSGCWRGCGWGSVVLLPSGATPCTPSAALEPPPTQCLVCRCPLGCSAHGVLLISSHPPPSNHSKLRPHVPCTAGSCTARSADKA